MDHVHPEDAQAYYMDQLCTIALCGALAGVGIMMWVQDLLRHILAPQFRLLVLLASVVVLGLVVVRAIVLWQAVSQARGHQPGHDHGEAPCCSPALPHNVHDDHEHRWSPWRYLFLLLPVFIYLAGLPNTGFSPDKVIAETVHNQPANKELMDVAVRGDAVIPLEFTELQRAAFLPTLRQFYEGKRGRLLGMFLPLDDRTCTLARDYMICCKADARVISVFVISPEPLPGIKPLDWIEVEGQIQFRKRADRDEYIPVLQIQNRKQMRPADAPKDPNS